MNWYSSMTVRMKLVTTFLIVSFLFIVEGYTGLRDINQLSLRIDDIYNNDLVIIKKLTDIRHLSRDYRLLVFQHIGASNIQEMKAFKEKLKQTADKLDSFLKAKEQYKLTAEEDELFRSLVSNGNELYKSYLKIIELSEGFSKEDAFRLCMTENQKVFDANMDIIGKLFQLKERSTVENYEESKAVKYRAWLMMVSVVIGGILLVLAIFLLTIRSITGSISEAINTVSTTSTQIASTVEQHARTATGQAASVNETTTTIDELGVSSRTSAEQADSVAAMAKQALVTTDEGVRMAKQASDGMVKMKEKVESIGEQILHLSEQTGQIGKIATMVTDIAGQINMLALNAAVEAVRAGEQGKGFAVIAQEVRKLADQGKKSAEQANTIVADIQKATNSAVMVTEEGTKTVAEVAGIAQKAGEAFASISGVAGSVYENAQQVSLNSKQQVGAIKQVVEAMNQVNAGARETAAGISQTKIGIQKLNEAAQNLKKMV